MYDCIIIGSGIAGVSAAVNLKIRNKDFLLIGNKDFSAKVQKAENIQNYIGMPELSGMELSEALSNHVDAMEIEVTEKRVNSVLKMDQTFMLSAGSDVFESKTVIFATGVEFSKKIPGEDTFLGRGVSYCATCDGAFYKGKTIAVTGSSREAEKELEFLAEQAQKVYYLPYYLPGEDFKTASNVEIIQERPEELYGNQRVEKVRLKSGMELEVDGIFFLKDALAPSALLPGLKDDGMHIVVDRMMQTNIPGCFACGDCTGRPYQYMKAAGEGNIAAHSVISYLAEEQKKIDTSQMKS